MNGAQCPLKIRADRCYEMLRDVTRLEAGSLLRDVSRLGNDNHSQIARIKKPDGSRAWDLV